MVTFTLLFGDVNSSPVSSLMVNFCDFSHSALLYHIFGSVFLSGFSVLFPFYSSSTNFLSSSFSELTSCKLNVNVSTQLNSS